LQIFFEWIILALPADRWGIAYMDGAGSPLLLYAHFSDEPENRPEECVKFDPDTGERLEQPPSRDLLATDEGVELVANFPPGFTIVESRSRPGVQVYEDPETKYHYATVEQVSTGYQGRQIHKFTGLCLLLPTGLGNSSTQAQTRWQ
jgi:hypothetical protein